MTAATLLQGLRTSATNALDLGILPGTVVDKSIVTSVMVKDISLRTVTLASLNQIAITVPSLVTLPVTALKTRVFVTPVRNLVISARIVQIAVVLRILMLSASSVMSLATLPETAQRGKERRGNAMYVVSMVTWPGSAKRRQQAPMTKKL